MNMPEITGIILAGGQARRMGGGDKGLRLLDGKPMIEWVLQRFVPQVSRMVINANQNVAHYQHYGYPVVSDALPDFAGPLAGLHAVLSQGTTPFVVTVPCDSPFLPADLVSRLYGALEAGGAELAVARTFDQPHPVFCLYRNTVLPALDEYLVAGNRKIHAWHGQMNGIEVVFDDVADGFRNINTPEELENAGVDLQGSKIFEKN